MSLRLRIEHGQDAGRTWRLPAPGAYLIGRQPGVSMRVLDMRVSKHHCLVQVAAQGGDVQAVFRDLGSTHGSQVNGQPVTEVVRIRPGDELRVGMTILRVLSDGEADEDARPVKIRGADEGQIRDPLRDNGNDGRTKQTLPPDELVGRELSGYTIERKIGAGGMGGVYVAEQTSLQRKVALKVLNEKFAADSAFVDQFVNEARAAGALNHPNVVQVYDVGNTDGRYFFSMELMPGGSMEDRLREEDVGWQEVLNWFIDAANALIFAKKRNILHRDVKPDNLMLAEDGSTKLCDLGLAKKSEVGDLMSQGIIGTPHFISPEAIRRKPDIDHRTDLYSLGCTFFRAFTRKNPYPGQTVKEILLSHLNKPVPHVNGINRNVPKELDEIVFKLMQKDPAERFQTPDELLRALDKVRTQYRLEAHGIKPASRRPLVIGVAAAAIAIGVAVYFGMRPEKVRERAKTPEEIQAEIDARRNSISGDLRTYVAGAGQRVNDLDRDRNKGKLSTSTWKSPLWPRLVSDYRREADGWDKKLEAWQQALAAEEDEEVQGYYRTEIANLRGHVENARAAAKEIEEEVAEHRSLEKLRKERRTQVLAEADAMFKAHSEKVRAHFDKREFGDVERLLQPTVIKEMVDTLLAEKVGRFPLLVYADDVKPLLDKYLPGDEKGNNRGKALIDQAVTSIRNQADLVLEEARKAQGEKPDPDTFQKAIDILVEAQDELPLTPDESAVRTSAAYQRARNKLDTALKNYRTRKSELVQSNLAHDREVYWQLLKKLWAPRTSPGLLRSFQLAEAVERAKIVVRVMKTSEYRDLAQGWLVRSEALVALFDRLRSSFPDGWVSTNYWSVDARGKRKKTPIQEVTAQGVVWERENHSYAELGAGRLLAEIFYVQEEEDGEAVPRIPLDKLQRHGLAVLAEMAGDYEAAGRHYRGAEQDYGDDPLALVVRKRIGKLGLERQAAEKWLAVVRWVRESEAWARQWRALVRSDDFDKEARERLLVEAGVREQQAQTMQALRYELLETPALAATAWGASIRDAPHPRVKYFEQEVLPPEPPKQPEREPKKDAGGSSRKRPDRGGEKPPRDGDGKKPDGDGG